MKNDDCGTIIHPVKRPLFICPLQTGFVKAFSDSPQSFTAGFCQVERVMKSLFIRKLFLWPRFHASVSACFDKHRVDVVELHLHMTPTMKACQTSLLDLIDACIKELRRANPAVGPSVTIIADQKCKYLVSNL